MADQQIKPVNAPPPAPQEQPWNTIPLESAHGVYQTAYNQLLHQPGELSVNATREGQAMLMSTFAQQYKAATGNEPTRGVMERFLGEATNPGWAQAVLLRQNAPGLAASMAKNFIESAPEVIQPKLDAQAEIDRQVQERTNNALIQKLRDITGQQQQNLTQQISQQFNPIRQRTISEQARLGRLASPVSNYNLRQVDTGQANALAQGLSQLQGNQYNNEINIAKSIEDIMQQNKQLGQQQNQFQQNMGLQKQGILDQRQQRAQELDLQNRQQELASQLGKMMADSQKAGPLDFVNLGFKGVDSLANVVNAFKKK